MIFFCRRIAESDCVHAFSHVPRWWALIRIESLLCTSTGAKFLTKSNKNEVKIVFKCTTKD